MTKHQPSLGEMISTLTFILFGVLLSLAAMMESETWKSLLLALCAALSWAGAARFKLQAYVDRQRERRR
jgi:hypothetical protein